LSSTRISCLIVATLLLGVLGRIGGITGNLKAVQKLLGHSSIQTTADIYTDWDIDQLATSLSEVLLEDEN
jgi:integrase